MNQRLFAHLEQGRNHLLTEYLETHRLAFRYDRIVDTDVVDWPKTVEAYLLHRFEKKFDALPLANRRREAVPDLTLDLFFVNQRNFDFLARN